jgi:hypothetical protein
MTDSQTEILKDQKVLVATWYEDDGWYGKHFRCILSSNETAGFKNAKEAKQHKALLARYVTEHFHQKKTAKQISFGIMSSYVQYTYCSMGPSLYYDHYHRTVQELLDWSKEHPKKLAKDMSYDERKHLREVRKAIKAKKDKELNWR